MTALLLLKRETKPKTHDGMNFKKKKNEDCTTAVSDALYKRIRPCDIEVIYHRLVGECHPWL